MDTIVVFDPAPGPASGLSVTYIDEAINTGQGVTSYTESSVTLGTGKIYVGIMYADVNGEGVSTVTIGGVSASVVTDGGQDAIADASAARVEVWSADVATATGDIVVTWGGSGADEIALKWYLVTGQTSVHDVTPDVEIGSAAPWTLTCDVNTLADGAVLVFGGSWNRDLDFETKVGFTQDGSILDPDSVGSASWISGSATGLTAETPRTITIGDTDTGLGQAAGVAISLE